MLFFHSSTRYYISNWIFSHFHFFNIKIDILLSNSRLFLWDASKRQSNIIMIFPQVWRSGNPGSLPKVELRLGPLPSGQSRLHSGQHWCQRVRLCRRFFQTCRVPRAGHNRGRRHPQSPQVCIEKIPKGQERSKAISFAAIWSTTWAT